MKDRKYVVCRDKVYVGEVVRMGSLCRKKDTLESKIDAFIWRTYRSMLFTPNEDKMANDLLYQSPNYPVLNMTDDEICLNLESNSILIREAYNLDALLEYFGYQKCLTFEDIKKIRRTFFDGRFAKDHCALFGWKEIKAEDITFYINGKEITDPRQLREYRMFEGPYENLLPREYFDILDERGDNTISDAIFMKEKMNAFAPHKEEGPIKKLTRF